MRRFSAGFWALLLLFLGGLWLVLSPFAVVASQPARLPWSSSTISNVAAGGGIALVALAGMMGYLLLWLRELLAEAAARRAQREGESTGGTGPAPSRS
ncbi:MAG: hypothetical protein K6U79_05455 [Firmicutes bacterium]|nr:hypothetical protein [Bacillota bacterium]